MKNTILFLVLMICSAFVHAGSKYTGVVRPYFYNSALYLSPLNVKKESVPACATRTLLRLKESDLDSSIFQMKFSILLAAYMAGKEVVLYGSGNCTGEGDEMVFAVIPL